MELRRVIEALEQKGAIWKAATMSRKRFQNTFECSAIVRSGENILRAVVEYYDNTDIKQAKCEVTCYFPLERHKKDKEEELKIEDFKYAKHPRDKQSKAFEYQDEVRFTFVKVLGISLGWKPTGPVPAEHTYISEMCRRACAKEAAEAQAASATDKASKSAAKEEEKTRARRALFG